MGRDRQCRRMWKMFKWELQNEQELNGSFLREILKLIVCDTCSDSNKNYIFLSIVYGWWDWSVGIVLKKSAYQLESFQIILVEIILIC